MNPGMLAFPKQNIVSIDPEKNYQTSGGGGSATASLSVSTVTNVLAFTTPNTPGMIYTCNLNASIQATNAAAGGDATSYVQIAIPGKPTIKYTGGGNTGDEIIVHTVQENQNINDIQASVYYDEASQEKFLYGEPFKVGPNTAVYVLFYLGINTTFNSSTYALVYSYLGSRDLGDIGGKYE